MIRFSLLERLVEQLELSPEEKNAISHRGLAMKKLMEEFPTWQNKH